MKLAAARQRARSAVRFAVGLALAGCQPKPAPAGDASAASPEATTPGNDAMAALNDARAALVAASVGDVLSLVAVGSQPGAKLVALRGLGSTVWVSGMGIDAYADGDAPLVAAPDLLKGLSYAPDDRLVIVGQPPSLFAYRGRNTDPVPVYIQDNEAYVRAASASGDAWKKVAGFPDQVVAVAFVAWNGGALFIAAQAKMFRTRAPIPPFEPGHPLFEVVGIAPDGTLTHPQLGIPRDFFPWSAVSDGTTLSLLGSFMVPSSGGDAGNWRYTTNARDLVVLRKRGDGPFQATTVVPMFAQASMATALRGGGRAALVLPPPLHDDGLHAFGGGVFQDEPAWKGSASTLFVVAGDEGEVARLTFRTEAEQDCAVRDATQLGDVTWAVVGCATRQPPWLVRFDSGAATRLSLPSIALHGGRFGVADAGDTPLPCRPKKLVAREPDDLWIEAECGEPAKPVPAVFRRGRAQAPIVLP
jgi:hypothetical protein